MIFEKGHGLFCKKSIEPGDFLLEYRGRRLEIEEAESNLNDEGPSNYFFLDCMVCLIKILFLKYYFDLIFN